MLTIRERFDAKADRQDGGCWLWTMSLDNEGYGRLKINGNSKLAHRISYEQYVGVIPNGLTIDHLCRVRSCVNPSHLEAVTHVANVMRGVGVGAVNAAKTHCPQGHEYDYVEASTGRRRCHSCRLERRRAKECPPLCPRCGLKAAYHKGFVMCDG